MPGRRLLFHTADTADEPGGGPSGKPMGGIAMLGEKVAGYARALYELHGDKAEAEAAQKMAAAEEAGKTDEVEQWRAVREAVRALRGANQG